MNIQKPDQVSLGWGRAAAMRFAKSEEEIKADIMKALEGKLSVEFQDYTQWQRLSTDGSATSRPSTKTTLKPKSLSSAVSSSKQSTEESVIEEEANEKLDVQKVLAVASLNMKITSGCSSLCLHPWNKKEPPADHTAENEKNQRTAILKAQIASKKHSVLEYLKLRKMLRVTNEALKEEIIETEEKTHKAVTHLLEKFEKYSSASKVLAERHRDELKVTLKEFKETKEKVYSELEKMEKDDNATSKRLNASEADLHILRTYKDKVYPEKALTIAKLHSNIQNISQDHKEEESDLDRVIDGERSTLEQTYKQNAERVIAQAADRSLQYSTIDTLDGVSDSNVNYLREIRVQREEIEKLEEEILQLKEEIIVLKSMDKSNMQKYVFPEVFPSRKKCGPDDDIVLDIPVRRFMPI